MIKPTFSKRKRRSNDPSKSELRDLDIGERKIHIYEGEKNCLGRVVYLSDDALMATA